MATSFRHALGADICRRDGAARDRPHRHADRDSRGGIQRRAETPEIRGPRIAAAGAPTRMSTAERIDLTALLETGPLTKRRASVFAWICLLMALEGYDLQVMAYAAPSVMEEFAISRAAFG